MGMHIVIRQICEPWREAKGTLTFMLIFALVVVHSQLSFCIYHLM